MSKDKRVLKRRTRALLPLLLAAALLLLPATRAAGQEDAETIRVETDLVNVNVAVIDRDGRFVEGLDKENFEIYDEGAKQEIGYFSGADAPISYGIVYDMHPTTDERTAAVLGSLREFGERLRERDDVFTLVFNRRGSLVTDFVPTPEQVRTHLAGRYREPNALYDAIYLAAEKIRARPNLRKVLLVITDSADHNSEHRFADILEQARTLDVQIYSVLWDEAWEYYDVTGRDEVRRRVRSDATNLSRAALQELALKTGATVRSPAVRNAAELLRIYELIDGEMRRHYTLGFYPERADGEWHELLVRLRGVKNGKKMMLIYRAGYKRPSAGP